MSDDQKIFSDEPVRNAFPKITNNPDTLTLFVFDRSGRLEGTLTDGDIRRGFIKGYGLDDPIGNFVFKQYSFIKSSEIDPVKIREIKSRGVRMLPVIDEKGEIERIIDFSKTKTILPVDAVLMAGGRGERLRPLTDKLPKPMLDICGKPLIELNIDRIISYGIADISVSLGYLGNIISDHLGDGTGKGVSIRYYQEEAPLGTIGALKHFESGPHDVLLTMNSDLFTNIDLEDFYHSFIGSGADMAVATVPYNVDIPFAIITEHEDRITELSEKPRYTYFANAGIYLIKRSLIKSIHANTRYDATNLISDLIADGKKVIKYPLLGFWIDIGRPEDYSKVLEFARHINYI